MLGQTHNDSNIARSCLGKDTGMVRESIGDLSKQVELISEAVSRLENRFSCVLQNAPPSQLSGDAPITASSEVHSQILSIQNSASILIGRIHDISDRCTL